MDTPGIPNLDAMTVDELQEVDHVLLHLRNYIELRRNAIQFRIDGLINDALRNEALADRVYKALPEWARW